MRTRTRIFHVAAPTVAGRVLRSSGSDHFSQSRPSEWLARVGLTVLCAALLVLPTSGVALAQNPNPDPNNTGQAPSGSVATAQQSGDRAQADLQFVKFIDNDLNQMWSTYFAQNRWSFTAPQLIDIEPGYQLADPCSNSQVQADTLNAYYCNKNDSIELPMVTIDNAMQGQFFGRFSDPAMTNAGVAGVVAHEEGHAIEARLQQLGTPISHPLGDGTPYPELFADCAAGTWFYHAYYAGYLQQGDLQSIEYGLEQLADPPNYSGPNPHGSPEDRATALLDGYNSGQPARCMRDYLGTPVNL